MNCAPELLYMKREFAMVNSKLDSLMSGQEEIKAKLDFNARIKDINVGKIETMNLEVYAMMQKLEGDWTATGSFSEQTKRDLDNFIGRVQNFEFCLDHQFTRQFPDKIVCLVKHGKL